MSQLNSNLPSPYIDRKVAEGLFRELLSERPTYRVLNIYGKAGSGKSYFLNYIEAKYLTKSKDIISIKLNFEDRLIHKPQSAIMHMAKELEQTYGFNFIALWKAYAILWRKRYEHSPIMYAADLPYFEELKQYVNLNKNLSTNIAAGIFGEKVSEELEALKELDTKSIESRLYQFFATDLRRIIKESSYKDCVVIFENLDILREVEDKTPCSNDAWVRDLIAHIGKEAMFIVSSKEQLNWSSCNKIWNLVVKESKMSPFIKRDALRYLRYCDITDEALANAVVLSSAKEPFWLSLAAFTYKDGYEKLPTSKKEILIDFIDTIDTNLAKVLEVLSFSRFFTLNLIYKIKDNFSISLDRQLITKLLNLPFIKELSENRFVIDSQIRFELSKLCSKAQEVEYKAFFFSYYENILQSLDSQIIKSNPYLVDEAIEEAWYHLNLINKEPLVHFEWLDYYIERFYMYAAWEPFLDRYNNIIPRLKRAKDKISKDKLVSLYNNMAGLYESLGDTKISKLYYNKVVTLNRPRLLIA